MTNGKRLIFLCNIPEKSANAVPNAKNVTPELYTWDNRKGQPNQSAMEGPRSGETTSLDHGWSLCQVSMLLPRIVPVLVERLPQTCSMYSIMQLVHI